MVIGGSDVKAVVFSFPVLVAFLDHLGSFLKLLRIDGICLVSIKVWDLVWIVHEGVSANG